MSAVLAPPRQTAGVVSSDSTIRMVRAAVRRKRAMFPDFRAAEDDLNQEGLKAVFLAQSKYDPGKATWSTFVGMVVGRTCMTIARGNARRAAREAKAAVTQDAAAKVVEWVDLARADGLPGGMGGDDETVEDWAAKVYRQAVETFPPRRQGRGGRNWFPPAQVLVAVLVMRRLSLSTRGAEMYFGDNRSLRESIGMERHPSRMWFQRAASYVTHSLKLPIRPEMWGGGE